MAWAVEPPESRRGPARERSSRVATWADRLLAIWLAAMAIIWGRFWAAELSDEGWLALLLVAVPLVPMLAGAMMARARGRRWFRGATLGAALGILPAWILAMAAMPSAGECEPGPAPSDAHVAAILWTALGYLYFIAVLFGSLIAAELWRWRTGGRGRRA